MITITKPASLEAAIKKYDLALSYFYIDLGNGVHERNKPVFHKKTPVIMNFMRSTSGKTMTHQPAYRTMRNIRVVKMRMGDIVGVKGIKFHNTLPPGQRDQFRYMKQMSNIYPESRFWAEWWGDR